MVEAARRFDAFIRKAKASAVPELHRLAKTMSRWRREILAHHRTGASNGPTEAVNHLIKKVLRVAHGFRNLDNYRLRLLLHCGSSGRLLRRRESGGALPAWSRTPTLQPVGVSLALRRGPAG